MTIHEQILLLVILIVCVNGYLVWRILDLQDRIKKIEKEHADIMDDFNYWFKGR